MARNNPEKLKKSVIFANVEYISRGISDMNIAEFWYVSGLYCYDPRYKKLL